MRSGAVSATHIDLSSASDAVRDFYGAGAAPIWSVISAAALERSLRQADRHGLDPTPYLDMIDKSADAGTRDLNRTRAALAYAKALAGGVVDPRSLFAIYTLPTDHDDLSAGLRAALSENRLTEWLDGLAPQDPEYRALSAAYVDMAAQAATAPARIADGPIIRIGDSDSRRDQILAAIGGQQPVGDPATAPTEATQTWTEADASLLKTYQRSRGLQADGVVGPNTLTMLNASPRDKARRLAVNLERLRWLERNPPATRIDVNTAASTLKYIVDGQVVWTTAVATGRPGHATPQLQAPFSRLVVNPPWYVPDSIARDEIDPKGPGYLAEHHMQRVGGRIIQSPGPWAALGQVKFDMQDRYAIYLHDTPAKSLFARSQRHLSHGCVRVEHAVDFARRLAEESGEGARFDAILASGDTGVVSLKAEIPVRLIYQTALVGDDGEVTFRPDVYGWDRLTADAMAMSPPAREGVEPITAAPLGP